jgi:hypothetical protein
VSWEELLDILAGDAQLAREESTARPTACPNDGHPLETGPNGELHCVFDGFVWSGLGG